MVVKGPNGVDLVPLEVTLHAGEQLYRVFRNNSGRAANVFNPGHGEPTRFAFFGNHPVPVLYAAATQEAAVAETLLHDIPIKGGVLLPDTYEDRVMGRITAQRNLRLASFMGGGFRALGVAPSEIVHTEADGYGRTVKWAEAAYEAGFDGCAWLSRQFDTDRAYVFFARPENARTADFSVDTAFGRAFALPGDFDWLSDRCLPLKVDVRR